MIWIIYYALFLLLTAAYSFFIFKNKLNKNKIIFLIYYFFVFFSSNALNNFLALQAQRITSNATFLILFNIIFVIVVILFAVPATFFTAKLKKRKLYIWWFHSVMFLAVLIGLISTQVWVLFFVSIALGMSTSALGVHQLMFNEQNFKINKGFLSYTLLFVPTLLSNLLIYPIQYHFAISNNNLSHYFLIFFSIVLISTIISFTLSFFLKETKNDIGIYDDFVLSKIKSYELKHFVTLVALAFLFFLVYYFSTNSFLNYKLADLSKSIFKPYLPLINGGSEVIGVFVIGYFLFNFLGIRKTLAVSLGVWIIAFLFLLFFNNIYVSAVVLLFINFSYGIIIFILYSLVLEWNYRQTAPLTGIYSAIVAVLTLVNNLLTSLFSTGNITITTIHSHVLFDVLSVVGISFLLVMWVFVEETISYWSIEEQVIEELHDYNI